MRKTSMQRQKPAPKTFWSDRQNRLGRLLGRNDIISKESNFTTHVIVWICQGHDDKVKTLVAIDSKDIPLEKHLTSTSFGLICSNCKTNEFIASQKDFHSITRKELVRFDPDRFGYYCTNCGKLSHARRADSNALEI